MAMIQAPLDLFEEVAEFLASGPTSEQLLRFRPSEPAQQRARELLEKNRVGCLAVEERQELDRCIQVELLMQLVKAKARLAHNGEAKP